MGSETWVRRAVTVLWRPGSSVGARGLAAGWPSALRARPALGDAALVLALLLLLVQAGTTPAVFVDVGAAAPPVDLGGHWRDPGWAWALQLALVLPMLARRRAPLAVLLVVSAVAFVQVLAGPELYGDLVLLIAVYTVVAFERRGWAVLVGVAVAGAALALGVARWVAGTDAGAAPAIALAGMAVLPVASGLGVRAHRRAVFLTQQAVALARGAQIAREMQDVVAHDVAAMIALSDGVRLTIARDPEAAEVAILEVARAGRDAEAALRAGRGAVLDGSVDGEDRWAGHSVGQR